MSRPRARAPWVACALMLAPLASAPQPARAAIHVCTTEAGTTVFQDRPCERRTPNAGTAPAARARASLGIHDSWFARPYDIDIDTLCDERGCRCGTITRPFDGNLALAVADAFYLDGAWHRHDVALAERDRAIGLGLPTGELQALLDEAACDVALSQSILRRHAPAVLADLRRRAREAEERGYDDARVCDGGDLRACGYLDALALYRRMVIDLAALRSARGGDAGGAAAGRGLDETTPPSR